MANIPLFKDVGKAVADLIKIEHNREVKVKTTTQQGLTFESIGQADAAGSLSGIVKTTFKHATYGNFEDEISTAGKSKGSWKTTNLIKGLALKLSYTEKPTGALDIDYQTDLFSVSSNVEVSGKSNTLGVAALVGFEGLSTGGEVKYDASAQKLSDYNGAAEYAQKDFNIALKTKNSADVVEGSYLHKATADLQVGGLFSYSFSGSRVFTGVFSYSLDPSTSIKATGDSNGIVSALLEQKLSKPALKYAFSTEFNTKTSLTAPKNFGLSLAFGDY